VPRRRTSLRHPRDDGDVSASTDLPRLQYDRTRQVHTPPVELVCVSCGFGAIVASPPARCPMCGGGGWRVRQRVDGHSGCYQAVRR
jgi:hypothetical protein